MLDCILHYKYSYGITAALFFMYRTLLASLFGKQKVDWFTSCQRYKYPEGC